MLSIQGKWYGNLRGLVDGEGGETGTLPAFSRQPLLCPRSPCWGLKKLLASFDLRRQRTLNILNRGIEETQKKKRQRLQGSGVWIAACARGLDHDRKDPTSPSSSWSAGELAAAAVWATKSRLSRTLRVK